MTIETTHLKLIPCNTEILHRAIQGNELLAKQMNIIVPNNWTEFGSPALQYALDKLSENEAEHNWWTWLPVHRQDNTLIGSGGYKGGPDAGGTVEIGYEIAEDYRKRGLATEMAKGLIEHAFADARVKAIIAHTLGQDNASTRMLQKCGFQKTEELNDPDEGLIWKWELKK